MVCNGNRIDVYVDFIPVVSTDSSDDALALLIAMYTLFELTFDKKSRTIRLLYSILHSDKRYLSNTLRHFITQRNIDIYCEGKYKLLSSFSDRQSNNSTTDPQAKSQSDSASIDKSVHEDFSSIISQAPQANPLNNTDDSDAAMTTNLNE